MEQCSRLVVFLHVGSIVVVEQRLAADWWPDARAVVDAQVAARAGEPAESAPL
jgi:hypothetical protein